LTLVARERAPQPLVLVVPQLLGDEARARLATELAALTPAPRALLTHALAEPADEGKRWLLLVDPVGAIRFAAVFRRRQAEFPQPLRHWLAVLRDQGRPPRELPAYERGR